MVGLEARARAVSGLHPAGIILWCLMAPCPMLGPSEQGVASEAKR